MILRNIADFAPPGIECGTGLALQDETGRHIFCLAGVKYQGPPGELFYAGIGGHLERGEDWLSCIHRETKEEIGIDLEVISSPVTWHVPQNNRVQNVNVIDYPRPFALYEMVYPLGLPKAGQLYFIVIYQALLPAKPLIFSKDEVGALIGLTTKQVISGINRKPSLEELKNEGTSIIEGDTRLDMQTRVYPIGTALALAHIFRADKAC